MHIWLLGPVPTNKASAYSITAILSLYMLEILSCYLFRTTKKSTAFLINTIQLRTIQFMQYTSLVKFNT